MPNTVNPPPDAAQEAENLRQNTRSPHPYLRHGLAHGQSEQDAGCERTASSGAASDEQGHSAPVSEQEWRRPASSTGSGSGTEADDERPRLVKALPAPTLRPHKGWKFGKGSDGELTPLLTPSQLDDEGRRFSTDGYFKLNGALEQPQERSEEEEKAAQDKLRWRRFAEFLRRSSEVVLLGLITLCALCGRNVVMLLLKSHLQTLLAHLAVVTTLVTAYPIRLSFLNTETRFSRPWQRFRVPAAYDPATILYPTFLPVLIALSVLEVNEDVLLPNIILALSSLPQRLFPRATRFTGLNVVHWFVSLIPAIAGEMMPRNSSLPLSNTYSSTCGRRELLATLYPLHQTMLPPLHYLTTTSLLSTELQMLSTSLINLLLFTRSPQANILRACLWIGGALLYLTCYKVLRWNITLARVPKWKLRRPGYHSQARHSLVDAVRDVIVLNRVISSVAKRSASPDSDADEVDSTRYGPRDEMANGRPRLLTTGPSLPAHLSGTEKAAMAAMAAIEPRKALMAGMSSFLDPSLGRRRRHTLPDLTLPDIARAVPPKVRRKSSRQSQLLWCLQLTPAQAETRRWLYAGWIYLVIIVIILGPVRSFVASLALYGQEPIGWALGYLLGGLEPFRSTVEYFKLESWIALPLQLAAPMNLNFSMILDISAAREAIGAGTIRLLLFAYWALALLAGLLTVFSLTTYVEVDTRRKVFHGVMVAMLLPTTFIDPCFCALALSLVLAVFLLLEVIRAGQVPPIGNAIGRFVAPYVDGRDLRGPVVVSHIFLLIGCAVPLWCSLAGTLRASDDSRGSWELSEDTRDVGMIAGVVCVGMGDAAASLFGRRYGRRKWIWIGGKSLEGSAAFAVAVIIGLMAGKLWLTLGGWSDGGLQPGIAPLLWIWTFLKAVLCACGASFMEAVLTGANDNIVVPVALWLLVKGVRL